jgi:hypothetical protein
VTNDDGAYNRRQEGRCARGSRSETTTWTHLQARRQHADHGLSTPGPGRAPARQDCRPTSPLPRQELGRLRSENQRRHQRLELQLGLQLEGSDQRHMRGKSSNWRPHIASFQVAHDAAQHRIGELEAARRADAEPSRQGRWPRALVALPLASGCNGTYRTAASGAESRIIGVTFPDTAPARGRILDRHLGDGPCVVGGRSRDCYEPAWGRLAEVASRGCGMLKRWRNNSS